MKPRASWRILIVATGIVLVACAHAQKGNDASSGASAAAPPARVASAAPASRTSPAAPAELPPEKVPTLLELGTPEGCEPFYDTADACSLLRAMIKATTDPAGRQCVSNIREPIPGYGTRCSWVVFDRKEALKTNHELFDCFTRSFVGEGVACSVENPRGDDHFHHYKVAEDMVRRCLRGWKVEHDNPRRAWNDHPALEATKANADGTTTHVQVCSHETPPLEGVLDGWTHYEVELQVFDDTRAPSR